MRRLFCRKVFGLITLVMIVALTGCGQSGALHVPETGTSTDGTTIGTTIESVIN